MSDASIARFHNTPHRRFARVAFALLLAIGLLAGPTVAQADSRYTSARKLGRGFANTGLGVLALPGHMMIEIEERGPGLGIPIGFGKGLGMFVATELVGVWEILSCPFEAPPGFRPILSPEWPWQYFE